MMAAEKRHFDNPYPDFQLHKENQLLDLQAKKIHASFVEQLKGNGDKLLEILEEHMPSGKRDGSVYTGSAGIAYLYLMLSEKNNNPVYLEKAADQIEKSLKQLKNRDISFLCGDAGPLAIAAVVFYKQNKTERSKECVSQLLGLMPRVAQQDSNVPDELLYGRVGYLYSLMFTNKHIPGIIPNDFFKQVVDVIIKSGQELAAEEKLDVPLMFQWHNKFYMGGAHGVAGILFLLMQAKQYLTSEQLQMVRPTVDFLLSIRYKSGNFPSSLGSNSDRLVHWCHGCPGTVQLLCAAYQAFNDSKYLQAAETCGEVVWERGLLRKGYGICHGVAGNAYTFLSLFQLTRDLKHLYRACKFAEWCFSYNQYQERAPDRPYSLFEGLAGTVYFLNDVQDPLQAKFPCFTL